VLVGDGGEKETGCNINYLLEEYGMSINSDSVMRSVYYKYLHPKEVFIADGVLVPDLCKKKVRLDCIL
jgi:intraflagellar transport protein 52